MLKNLLTLVFILSLFISCGGGGTTDDGDLPPDPGDAGLVDLLGIDVNNNGVRDDVERYIHFRFQGYPEAKKEKVIATQFAKATQVILVDPENAYENKSYKVMHDALDCMFYYWTQQEQNMTRSEEYVFEREHDIFDTSIKNIIFNTRDRLKAKLIYNQSLGGHIYPSRSETLDKCETNIDLLE